MALLDCRGLTRAFGAFRAVEEVDLAVEAGEIRAVIGPNGAGKTTLFHLITGLLPKTAGSVRFKGEDISRLSAHAVAARGIARTFQITALFPRLAAAENVRLAVQARRPGRYAALGGRALRVETERRAARWLARVGLDRLAAVPAGVLSHGDQRLLEVAVALAQEPALLILDEPTQGMSVEETRRTVDLLGALLAEQQGLAVLLVEHDLEVVFALAHRIAVLHHGRKIADGAPAEVRADAAVQAAYLGGLD